MNADRVIVGEVLGDEVIPMLNAMSQGRSGSMCTIHADSSAGCVPSPGLVCGAGAGAICRSRRRTSSSPVRSTSSCSSTWTNRPIRMRVPARPALCADPGDKGPTFVAARRRRFVSSIREVVDSDGMQIVSNEIFRPGADRSAVPAAPLRSETLEELMNCGYEPAEFAESRSWT